MVAKLAAQMKSLKKKKIAKRIRGVEDYDLILRYMTDSDRRWGKCHQQKEPRNDGIDGVCTFHVKEQERGAAWFWKWHWARRR